MSRSRLNRLQLEILRVLSGFEPRWVLTGGGALSGVHLGHRVTRDLDLFWHERDTLPDLGEALSSLEAAT